MFSINDYAEICNTFADINGIMIGRGILMNPQLCEDIRCNKENKPDYKRMRKFHNLLISGYTDDMESEVNAMFKMKELWTYMIRCFVVEENREMAKIYKKIRKTRDFREYMSLTAQLFDNYCA